MRSCMIRKEIRGWGISTENSGDPFLIVSRGSYAFDGANERHSQL